MMSLKLWWRATAIGVLLAMVVWAATSMTAFSSECAAIRDEVLRLHVLAHSDSEQDQQLKLSVRDRILQESNQMFYDLNSFDGAKASIEAELAAIERIARDEVQRQGYDYPVSVELLRMFFTNRMYGTLELPAGNYDAVRITIGAAAGKNWWCVLYPTLCLPAAEGEALTPAEERLLLEQTLGETGAAIVADPGGYQVEFALLELFEKAKDFLTRG